MTLSLTKYLAALLLSLPLLASAVSGYSYLEITATKAFPASVNVSSTTSASYQVKNILTAPLTVIDQTASKGFLPAGMTIVSTTCTSSHLLQPNDTCTVNLSLEAPSTVGGVSAAVLYESVSGTLVAQTQTLSAITVTEVAAGWTWMAGFSTVNQTGVYGTKGTSSASSMPGGRQASVSWLDSSDRLWLFGGLYTDADSGVSSYFNDLWRFDPDTSEWTWISGANTTNQSGTYGTQGTASTSNIPGARRASVSWIDSSGNFWLFGGVGYPASGPANRLNDLWQFNPNTLAWNWVSGSSAGAQSGTYGTKGTASASNVPSSRSGSVSWIDASGNLWLFGGFGAGASSTTVSYLNDLWKFNPNTTEWTWVSGANTINQSGTYGTQGIASTSNVPGARRSSVSWIDASGNLWLFGGTTGISTGVEQRGNDLWKFNPATLEWTWVSGANTSNQSGTYGSQGVASGSNMPGARSNGSAWIDASGDLWLMSGVGYDSSSSTGYLDDLWQFDPSTLQWTWVSGVDSLNQTGTYGTQGQASSTNLPGARFGFSTWLDSQGVLWFFGGNGYDATTLGTLADLWQYNF